MSDLHSVEFLPRLTISTSNPIDQLYPTSTSTPATSHDMTPKSPHPSILLLATLILLAPTVYGCVNFFAAQGETNGVLQATWLDAKLWDDGGSGTFTQVCVLSSNPPYNFNCNAGYSAVFNDDTDWTVTYTTPGGSGTFATDYTECGGSDGIYCSTWKKCQYNCAEGDTDCFVYDCGSDYWGCKPGYSS